MDVRAIRRAVIILLICSYESLPANEFVVPISANSPHVFLSLTEERDADDASFFSVPNAPPNREGLPKDADDHYVVSVFDTGAPATIISRQSFDDFGVAEIGRAGSNITPLGGVGPTISAINSDPLGVYAVGFDGLLTNPRNGDQTIDRSQLKGSFNDSILYGPVDTPVPNLVGTTTSSHYTTVIDYGDPQIIEYDGETHRSPGVNMVDLGSVPEPSRRIGLTIVPGALGTVPTFLPDLGNLSLDDLGDNPSTPTIAGSFWLRANVENNGVTRNGLEAIFDTGAQGSFVSEQLAAEMGFDVSNDKPDFVVRIAGVTGVSEEVPGFYADEFFLPGTDGGLRLTNVPLIVFDLADPRDGVNTLDALIGMNLFSSRDLILNPEPGNAYLGVSDPAQPFHGWASQQPLGTWNDPSNWSEPGTPDTAWYADLRNITGTPQVATIDADSTIGMLVAGGNAAAAEGTMTVSIQDEKALTIFGSAILLDGSAIELSNATLAPLAVEIRGGTVTGTGVVEGEVLSQGTLDPGGADVGMLTFPGSLDQLANGVLKIDLGANLQNDMLDVGGAMTLDGSLEISTTDGLEADAGTSLVFSVIHAESDIVGAFADYSFNGTPLDREFPSADDDRAFRDHVGDGLFLSVNFPSTDSFKVEYYQALAGDVNGDGLVEFDDFVVVAESFGMATDWTTGDFNGDGETSFADYITLAANFGSVATTSSAAHAVPEPSALLMLLFALTFFSGRRSRK